MAKMSKEIKSKKASFAKGGTNRMAPLQHAGQQTPGQTSSKSGKNSGGKFATGGKTPMAKFVKTQPAKPGSTAAR